LQTCDTNSHNLTVIYAVYAALLAIISAVFTTVLLIFFTAVFFLSAVFFFATVFFSAVFFTAVFFTAVFFYLFFSANAAVTADLFTFITIAAETVLFCMTDIMKKEKQFCQY